MNWYLKVLKNYAVFEGRARRKEYWMYTLYSFIIMVLAVLIDGLISSNEGGLPAGVLFMIYFFASIIPSLAVTVRRLHDTGKSGYWFFIYFVPLIGGIWLLILLITEGEVGPNKYGPDPKDENAFNEDTLDSHLAGD